ncbi:hypothetical protein TNCT_559711 [Trichonephila clavata]|uniref:Uncharacterized protein n=1 Tax=Trichonephila clavata TaxID=2740835 RepID=A0A8X6HJP9_TRICU|nr:hypothetical protein TNCT_559711 [Trichonephila clavata]
MSVIRAFCGFNTRFEKSGDLTSFGSRVDRNKACSINSYPWHGASKWLLRKPPASRWTNDDPPVKTSFKSIFQSGGSFEICDAGSTSCLDRIVA